MSPSSSSLSPSALSVAGAGLYPAVCVFVLVFLCTLPLTGVPDEALGWRFAGFAVTGIAAGWMSANGGAALLGLAVGHVVMLLLPETAPKAIGQHAYAGVAAALLGVGMATGRMLRSRRPADRAPFFMPGPLVSLAAIAAGLFPFAFARPNPEGAFLTLGLPVGFVAVVMLGMLSPGDARRTWAWFLLGHTPFLVLEFFMFVVPGLITMAVSWFCVWWGSALAASCVGVVPQPAAAPASAPAPVAARHGGGGRMG